MKRLNTIHITILFVFTVLFGIETTWAQPEEITFNFTGDQQSFVVPPNVFSIHIQAWGAQGANVVGPQTTGLGGLGGMAEGDLEVTPGQVLEIFVGGQGCVQSTFELGCGGFNGGGNAQGSTGNERGGGGGASDVRVGGTTLNNRVIVAAGGGGACPFSVRPGGNGGGLIGDAGGGLAGQGGTQNAGGEGFSVPLCLSGGFGFGGDAAVAIGICSGGGGGWYGGGSGCGAGGGSSYIDGVTNGNTAPGIRDGDGMVVIMFTPPVVRNVPTLSEWGLIAMATLFGIVGFIVIRRRELTT